MALAHQEAPEPFSVVSLVGAHLLRCGSHQPESAKVVVVVHMLDGPGRCRRPRHCWE